MGSESMRKIFESTDFAMRIVGLLLLGTTLPSAGAVKAGLTGNIGPVVASFGTDPLKRSAQTPTATAWRPAAASAAALLVRPALVRAEVVANPYAKAEAANAALRARDDAGGGLFEVVLNNGLNLVLTGVVLALVVFIASFALEAAKEVGDASRSISDAIQDNYGEADADDSVKQQGDFLYVDDNPNSRSKMAEFKQGKRATTSIKNRKEKLDFTKSESGFDFAPWMKIDQEAVAAAEAARRERKKKSR